MVNHSPNKTRDVAGQALWVLFDTLRGMEPIQELLDPVLTVAVLASQYPEDFHRLYKSPRANQLELLSGLIKQHDTLAELDSHSSRSVLTLSPESLQQIIYRLHDVTDWSGFVTQAIAINEGFQGRRGGEAATATSVACLIAALAGDIKQQSVYDGAAGLCEIPRQLDAELIRLEEINLSAWSMGKKLLLICGKEANYTPGDSLFDLQPSAQADWVITQPPWGVRFPAGRVQVLAQSDFLQYGHLERIPSSAGDALWVQHALYHTHESGKIIILLPQGILFRGGYDAKLRDYLLEHDLIETIIALPPGLFRHTGIPAVVLMLNKAKPEAQQGEVRLIDASDLGIPGSPQRLLSEQDQSLIVSLANGEQPQHPSFKAVLLPDIYQNDNVLNISRYIHQQDEMELPKLDEEKQKLQTALKTQQQAQSRLLDLLDLDQGGSA